MPEELLSFARIAGDLPANQYQPGRSILIGNGVSVNVWAAFGYASLYEVALSDAIPEALGDAEKQLFNRLGTNFERVLAALANAEPLFRMLGEEAAADRARDAHRRIRAALVHAVRAVHPDWEALVNRPDLCGRIADALQDYTRIYSTNYDVLIYWAILQRNAEHERDVFKDAFFSGRSEDDTVEFNVSNARTSRDASLVLYPHGALHLLRDHDGNTHKVCHTPGARILDRFGDVMSDHAEPLLVTEGDGDSKRASIAQTGYLSHCLEEMGNDNRSLVVLGHSLGESDSHLARAISDRHYKRHIAVGIHPSGGDIDQQIAHYRRVLAGRQNTVMFFDSRTHPLATPDLRLAP